MGHSITIASAIRRACDAWASPGRYRAWRVCAKRSVRVPCAL